MLKLTNKRLRLPLLNKKCLFRWQKSSLINCWPRLHSRRPSKPSHSNNNTCKLKLTRPKHRSQTSRWSSSKLLTRSLHKHLLLKLSSNSSHNYSRKPLSTTCRLLSSPCSSNPCRASMRNRCSPISSSIRRYSRQCHSSSSPNQQLILSRSTLSRHNPLKPIRMLNQSNNNCHRQPVSPRSRSPRPSGTDTASLTM